MKYNLLFGLFIAIAIASCSPMSEKHEEHEEHVTPKFQYTAYSSQYELFAEADAFVVGKKSNVLSHFSMLPSLKAVDQGSITIVLTIEGKEVRQKLDKPTRKGIYSFDITPETAGKGTLTFEIANEQGNFVVDVSEVSVFKELSEAEVAASKIVIPQTNTTFFSKEQSWKVDFATDYPMVEPFGPVIKTTALVQAARGDEAFVTATTSGIVMLAGTKVWEGTNVNKGQVLFTISANEFTDNNTAVKLAEAKNNFEKTKADYERSQELAKDKIVSDKELLDATMQYNNAKVSYDNLNKNASVSGQKVISPISGFVKQLLVTNGQYVEAGTQMATISQNKKMLITAELQQKYANLLGSIYSANIRTLHNNQTYSLEQLNGKIVSYGKSANTSNYLIPVTIQIDNAGNFSAGEFVEIYLKTLTNSEAITVPSTAILEEQGFYFVFVQVTPELFEKREVKTGGHDGLKTEIIKGITPNERIVTKGAMMIKLVQATGALDAHSGHVH